MTGGREKYVRKDEPYGQKKRIRLIFLNLKARQLLFGTSAILTAVDTAVAMPIDFTRAAAVTDAGGFCGEDEVSPG